MNYEKAEQIYANSIRVLEDVQLENGGCLATPRGERYPYVYPRDHAFCVLAFLSAGLPIRARKGLEFVLKGQLKSGAFPQRYDMKGRDASYKPIQIDGTGLILHAFCQYVLDQEDYKFAKKHWGRIKKAAKYITSNMNDPRGLVYTPNSVHEFPPSEAGLEVWANSTCFAALRDLSLVGEKMGFKNGWLKDARKIKDGVTKYMWNRRIKGFVKNIRIRESSSVKTDPDIAEYAIAYFGMLKDSDKRIASTVKRIEEELWNRELGGMCRYPKREGRHNGGYGPWPHYTLMLSRHYVNTKNKRKADKCIGWVVDVAYNLKLPEHISTRAEFEEYISDFTDAGLLRKDRLIMIKNARKHPMFKRGVAYITPTLAWPHAEFIMTWNLYKKIFFG